VIDRGTKETSRPPDTAARQERALQEAPLRHGLLSAREREVLDARARGLIAKEIAAELGIAEGTVRALLARIREKLRVL
jgi:RNA polymerase sigma factor (sigma-70 family)